MRKILELKKNVKNCSKHINFTLLRYKMIRKSFKNIILQFKVRRNFQNREKLLKNYSRCYNTALKT